MSLSELKVTEHPRARANLKKEIKRLYKSLSAPERIPLSNWCDKYRILAKEINAVGGRWDTDTAPYQREMLDTCGDWKTKEIVLCTSAQVGKTSMLENVIANYIVTDPGPIMVVFPEGSTLRAFSQDRIDTMVRDMPILHELVDSKRERDASNTITYKKFRGGHLTFTTAGSSRQLRSRPIRYLFMDEVDGYEVSISGEGDPIRLAKARTDTFFNKKIILTSTPTIEDKSRIWKAFKQSDQRFFYIKCPHCNAQQILVFGPLSQFFEKGKTGQLRWEENRPETAYYECVKGCVIESIDKGRLLKSGEWIKKDPEAYVAGFFINSLYSPWVQWSDIAREFLECKSDPFQLQVFVNTKLGEVWRERSSMQAGDLVTHAYVYDAPCPSGVGVITAGIDIQLNRIEVVFWGWGDGENAWYLDNHVVWKDPGTVDAWIDLEKVINRTFTTIHGAEIPVHAIAIDTGYQGEMVRRFVSSIKRKRVYAVVGINRYGSPILNKPRKSEKTNVLTIPIGTDTAKKLLLARLRIIDKDQKGYVAFPMNTELNLRDIFEQLTSERPVSEIKNGRRVIMFKKRHSGVRNEQLDCFVYAYAALLNIGYGVLEKLAEYAQNNLDKRDNDAKKVHKQEKAPSDEKVDYTTDIIARRTARFGKNRPNWQKGWGTGYKSF